MVPYNQILPSLGLLLFSLLIAQGCTADNRSVVTPVATFHSSVGCLSFDETRFQPLTQAPKVDAAGLELGLFSEQTGY
jgi:hypothetical protein